MYPNLHLGIIFFIGIIFCKNIIQSVLGHDSTHFYDALHAEDITIVSDLRSGISIATEGLVSLIL